MVKKSLVELKAYLDQLGFDCRIEGDARITVAALNTLEDAKPGELSFLSNPKYEKMLATTKASAVIANGSVSPPPGLTLLRCNDPYAGMTAVLVHLHGHRRHPAWGVHPLACIADSAVIGPDANIGPHAVVDEGVVIGRGATIYPGTYIAQNCRLGDDVLLYPNVTIYEGCILGHRVTIHASTVIGEDGLGYAPVGDHWVKIPQIGIVVVADDVEIGANCSIDRATLGKTHIGRGTKFSNMIAIGHGTKIGEDCLFVAQTGLAGSVNVGNHVTMGGQVGVVGHVNIGDQAKIGAKSGVINDVPPGVTVLGQPALPINEAKRSLVMLQRLPDLYKQMKNLKTKPHTNHDH